jgi:cysteine desulfurase / selenocysteine lyase
MKNIKSDFPIFSAHPDYIYLDNAATTHKPRAVLDAMQNFYSTSYATVHRGIYRLSEEATALYEGARTTAANFIGAKPEEIVFTKGATEGINLIAQTWGQDHIFAGDHIIVSAMEHHANLLPWQQLIQQKGAVLDIIPVNAQGLVDYEAYAALLTEKTKLVAITHSSHIFGTVVDVERISKAARAVGARILVDACQSAPRGLVNSAQIKPDFLVFSGHKMLGPTGIGILYVDQAIADEIRPYHVGGGMVFEADYQNSSWRKPPHRFEAGTPPIAEAVGLAAAINYLQHTIQFPALRDFETKLCSYASDRLAAMPGLSLLGPDGTYQGSRHIVNFSAAAIHHHDIGAIFDKQGIAVRAGDHCAQPFMRQIKLPGSVRLSVYCYTTFDDITYALDCLEKFLQAPFDR